MPEGAVFVLNQQKRGLGREGTQVNHRGAVLYSEGLLRKSLQLRKTWRLVCLGAGAGTEGASALQWSHSWGGGLGSQAGGDDISLFSQETMQRGGHAEATTRGKGGRGPQVGVRSGTEASGGGRPPGRGRAGEDRLAPTPPNV